MEYHDALNQDPNLVYLKKADYGLRILASVEIIAASCHTAREVSSVDRVWSASMANP